MDYIKAFLIGGLICAAVQILLDRTSANVMNKKES